MILKVSIAIPTSQSSQLKLTIHQAISQGSKCENAMCNTETIKWTQ
jgi:hypothetical protein